MGSFTAILMVSAAGAAGASVFMLAMGLLSAAEQSGKVRRTRRRVAASQVTSRGEGTALPAAPAETGWVASMLERGNMGARLASEVASAGLSMHPAAFVRRVMLASGAGFFGGWLFTGSFGPGVILAVGLAVGARVWLQSVADRRIEQMRRQLPDAFTMVAGALGSGLSLVQALEYAASETPAPLGPEFWRLVHDVSAGRSLMEALERFRATVPLRELKTISTALEIQYRVGGNIREMLEQATSSVRQTIELRMSLSSQTAQSRLSAKVVGLMPMVLLGVISLLSDDYVSSFFSTPTGIAIFSIGATLDLVGYALIRKIMEIEV